MVTLNQLISHLENLRDYYDDDQMEITVPVYDDSDDYIYFMTILDLADINVKVVESESGDLKKNICYIDFDQLLREPPELLN